MRRLMLCLIYCLVFFSILIECSTPQICFGGSGNERNGLLSDSLTDEEQKWIAEHPVITLALDVGNPPMNYRNAQEVLSGISIDYLKLMEKKLGIEFKLLGSDWNEALQQALDHKVDGIVNASIREERKPYLNFTAPYFTSSVALVTSKNLPPFANLNQLSGMKVVVIKGSIRAKIIEKEAPDSEIIEVTDLLEGLKQVSEGRADAIFEDLPVIQYMIETYFFSNLQVALLYYNEEAGESRIGLRNDEPELLSVINKAISAITPDEHREIRRKWLRISDKIHVQRDLTLTEAEKEWLTDHPVIKVASDPDWAPIEYMDAEGQYHGISIEYLKILEKKLGVDVEIASNLSWSDLLKKVENKELDMFSAISRSDDRDEFLEYTEPYLSVPIVIFSKQEVAYIKDLTELAGKKVGVIRGYAIQEWLSDDHPSIIQIPFQSGEDALRMLQKDDLDAYIGDLVSTSYLLTKHGYPNIKVVGESPYNYQISMGVRKDLSLFAGILKKSFDEITENERNQIYQNWISVRYEHQINYRQLGKVILGFLFLLLLFGYWNRRLAREIKERKLVEESLHQEKENLKNALDEIKILRGFLPICASCKSIRDDQGYWSQLEAYMSEHTEVQFSHSICPDCAKMLYPEFFDRKKE